MSNFKAKVNTLVNKLFGTTPGDGEMQAKEGMAYSIAGFGQNFICTIIGSYLTVFMTDALGFNIDVKVGALTGVVAVAILMLVTRLFDAFNDPIMGSIVDKTRTKYGKCRPYLKWMPIPIAVMTILCFLPFYKTDMGSFIGLSLVYVVWSVAYTIVDVPYWALSTAMTNDTTKRGNMLTVARMFCTVGAGIVTIFVPMITSAVTASYKYDTFAVRVPGSMEVVTGDAAKVFMDSSKNFLGQETWALKEGLEEQGFKMMEGLLNPAYAAQNAETLRWTYFIICVVLVVLAVPMFYYGFKHTKEHVGVAADGTISEKPNSFGHNLKLLFKNKELLLIVLSGILGGARMVYTYTGGLYFCKYALQNESAYSMLTMLVIPGGLVASVLTPWMTKKFSKKTSYIATHILGAVAMVLMFFMWDFKTGTFVPGGLIVSIVCMILLGIPQGINNIMTYAMIGDTIDYLEWKTGERGEGICFAMQTLINKIGMAVGAFIGVLAYAMAGISPSNPEGSMTIEGLNKLWMMLVLSGAVSFIACIIPMLFYTISEDKQRKMVAEIAAGTNPGAALKKSAEVVEVEA
ncbi:MAG: MFS transporter [Clostridia bacterium]|nr:MFS transporter [Clostridia bacterium]